MSETHNTYWYLVSVDNPVAALSGPFGSKLEVVRSIEEKDLQYAGSIELATSDPGKAARSNSVRELVSRLRAQKMAANPKPEPVNTDEASLSITFDCSVFPDTTALIRFLESQKGITDVGFAYGSE